MARLANVMDHGTASNIARIQFCLLCVFTFEQVRFESQVSTILHTGPDTCYSSLEESQTHWRL